MELAELIGCCMRHRALPAMQRHGGVLKFTARLGHIQNLPLERYAMGAFLRLNPKIHAEAPACIEHPPASSLRCAQPGGEWVAEAVKNESNHICGVWKRPGI